MDYLKFSIEMANELNKSHYQSLTPMMAENAVASAIDGVSCGKANYLADAYSAVNSIQYSVKMYKDNFVMKYINGEIQEERNYTDFIIERRISGVSDPNGDAQSVMKEVLQDVFDNENVSKTYYGVRETNTVLLGYSEDSDYFYFRTTVLPYEYEPPAYSEVKFFSEQNKNFNKHIGNRESILGYNSNGLCVYKWIHPNSQTYTRTLQKKYNLQDEESFYFKVQKAEYIRPSDDQLLSHIIPFKL